MTALHLIRAVSRDMYGDLPTSPRVVHEYDDTDGVWIAFYDGCDHVGPFGRGETVWEAEADLEDHFGGEEEWTR